MYEQAATSGSSSNLSIVIGNEASDADSLVCTMAYAFMLSEVKPKGGNLVVPVLSIPRADFNMRPEVHMLLQRMAGTSKAPFVFVDDLPTFKTRQHVDVYLVDHNTPSPQLTNSHLKTGIEYSVKGVLVGAVFAECIFACLLVCIFFVLFLLLLLRWVYG